jgi:hypothetical protein
VSGPLGRYRPPPQSVVNDSEWRIDPERGALGYGRVLLAMPLAIAGMLMLAQRGGLGSSADSWLLVVVIGVGTLGPTKRCFGFGWGTLWVPIWIVLTVLLDRAKLEVGAWDGGLYAVGGAAIAAVAVAVVLVITRGAGGSAVRPAGSAGTQTGAQAPAVADQNTGFDLYVTPAGITQWKLDGETRTDRLPSRIRGIAPGVHRVQIDAPPGFLSQAQRVEVVAGRAERVDIKLEPIQGIHGTFESTPPGAAVSLIIDGKRQELGASPAKAPLDPRHTYQVLFEKPGFVSVNKQLVFTGALEEKLAVTLEKASVAAEEPPKPEPTRPARPTPPRPDPPKVGVGPKPDPPRVDPPRVDPPKATGTGTLAINSKPSCEIYVDGASTGLYTPQLALKLPAGKRRITLVNNEYGIKESFAVEISPDKPAKMIKDYSDRLPK